MKKIIENGNRRGLSEPDEKEVALATKHIYTNSMFGVTLDELMAIQNEKRPELEIPWIQVTYSYIIWYKIYEVTIAYDYFRLNFPGKSFA